VSVALLVVRFAVFPVDIGIDLGLGVAEQAIDPLTQRATGLFQLDGVDQGARVMLRLRCHAAESAPDS
jgi:hypothetical protein